MTEQPQAGPRHGEIERAARRLRRTVLELSHAARTAHLGSALSCVDIVAALYWGVLRIDPSIPGDPTRDRFILSKGHAATALYAALSERGFFDRGLLETYARGGAPLAEHPILGSAPGIEATTGSLGHGLPLGLGLALGSRITRRPFRVVVLMSDGECNEGSVWEAAMLASAQRANNLAVIIDYNKWQATGRSEEITALQPLAEKWRAFGWEAHEVDGHDPAAIAALLRDFPGNSARPTAVVAHTTKGKGVSFMEDDNNWHYRIPNAEELQRALAELDRP